MTPMSRYPCCSCIKPIRKGVSKMTRSLTYVGVLVVVAGVLLTTCVGSAWSMEVLDDDALSRIKGRHVCGYVGETCQGAYPCQWTGIGDLWVECRAESSSWEHKDGQGDYVKTDLECGVEYTGTNGVCNQVGDVCGTYRPTWSSICAD